jgi:selenide,water dikinase
MEIIREAGVALVGGHSVEDDEPKYGLSVTGLVHPDKVMTNSGLQPGDRIVLTKAVGTGIIATAIKGGLASEASMDAMTGSLCTLNRVASEVAVSLGARACTDVTGFGLAGHLVEMATASACKIRLEAAAVPLLEGATDAASMGLVPAGAHANRKHFSTWIRIDPTVPLELTDVIFDPQTSGGLVIGIKESLAGALLQELRDRGVGPVAEIGTVVAPDAHGSLEIV